MRGRGTVPTTSQISTSSNNINLLNRLSSAKPALQRPGQIVIPQMLGAGRMRGGCNMKRCKMVGRGRAIADKFGAYLYVPNT